MYFLNNAQIIKTHHRIPIFQSISHLFSKIFKLIVDRYLPCLRFTKKEKKKIRGAIAQIFQGEKFRKR